MLDHSGIHSRVVGLIRGGFRGLRSTNEGEHKQGSTKVGPGPGSAEANTMGHTVHAVSSRQASNVIKCIYHLDEMPLKGLSGQETPEVWGGGGGKMILH